MGTYESYSNKEIGGYFELELPQENRSFLHSDHILVNSGRHALEYILRTLIPRIKKLYIPFYTCDVVLEPVNRLGLKYELYHVNIDLEIADPPILENGEYIIVNNYFGIKDSYINTLITYYKDRLIVDNAQAWYYTPESENVNMIYSPRKFFGVPDGGVAQCLNNKESCILDKDVSFGRCSHLLKRLDVDANAGYEDFRENSTALKGAPMKQMSNLTKKLLASIDFEGSKKRRISNYTTLADKLNDSNGLQLCKFKGFAAPLVYPYLTYDEDLRKRLIDNKIFVATYWPNVLAWCKNGGGYVEYDLAKYILPLPIDQRYDEEDMKKIINIVKS